MALHLSSCACQGFKKACLRSPGDKAKVSTLYSSGVFNEGSGVNDPRLTEVDWQRRFS